MSFLVHVLDGILVFSAFKTYCFHLCINNTKWCTWWIINTSQEAFEFLMYSLKFSLWSDSVSTKLLTFTLNQFSI